MAIVPSQNRGMPIRGDQTDNTRRGLQVRNPANVGKAGIVPQANRFSMGTKPDQPRFRPKPTTMIVQPSQRGYPLPVNPQSKAGYREPPPMSFQPPIQFNKHRSLLLNQNVLDSGVLQIPGKAVLFNTIGGTDGMFDIYFDQNPEPIRFDASDTVSFVNLSLNVGSLTAGSIAERPGAARVAFWDGATELVENYVLGSNSAAADPFVLDLASDFSEGQIVGLAQHSSSRARGMFISGLGNPPSGFAFNQIRVRSSFSFTARPLQIVTWENPLHVALF